MDRKERLGGASCCEGGRVLKIGKERRERAGKSGKMMGKMEQKESKRVSGVRDSLPGPEHIEGSRWKSGTVN